jgi:Protein of unknown function (DUF2911)
MIRITAAVFLFLSLLGCGDDKTNRDNTDTVTLPAKKQPLSIKKETPNPFSMVDVSPMDMSYSPADYPHIKHAVGEIPNIRLIYSRPQKQGRTVFGNIVQYDTIWRLGANESTEIEFFKPVVIQEQKIKAGRYTLYCIPRKDSWVIIMNTEINVWGLNIDTLKNIAKFTIPVASTTALSEYFTAIFEDTATGSNLIFAWDSVVAKLPIGF